MKPFRLKDPVTGLYYCPLREIKVKHKDDKWGRYVKSNLSKKGKVYFTSQPLEKTIDDHTQPIWEKSWNDTYWPKPLVRQVTFKVEYL